MSAYSFGENKRILLAIFNVMEVFGSNWPFSNFTLGVGHHCEPDETCT